MGRDDEGREIAALLLGMTAAALSEQAATPLVAGNVELADMISEPVPYYLFNTRSGLRIRVSAEYVGDTELSENEQALAAAQESLNRRGD